MNLAFGLISFALYKNNARKNSVMVPMSACPTSFHPASPAIVIDPMLNVNPPSIAPWNNASKVPNIGEPDLILGEKKLIANSAITPPIPILFMSSANCRLWKPINTVTSAVAAVINSNAKVAIIIESCVIGLLSMLLLPYTLWYV